MGASRGPDLGRDTPANVFSSNLLRDRVKSVRYQFVSPRYQLDPSNSTKERKNECNFPKVL